MAHITPAILEQDISEVQKKLDVVAGFAKLVQIDIADGKFVDNTTIRLEELQQITTTMPLEIHLMVQNPREQFALCQELKAYRVFWHYEADSDIDGAVKFARQFSFKKGIVLNPETDVSVIRESCQCLDAVLLMGVTPGAQGRPFDNTTIERVRKLKSFYTGPIAVDGAVSEQNIASLVAAGVTELAVGSALFKSEDTENRYHELVHLATVSG